MEVDIVIGIIFGALGLILVLMGVYLIITNPERNRRKNLGMKYPRFPGFICLIYGNWWVSYTFAFLFRAYIMTFNKLK